MAFLCLASVEQGIYTKLENYMHTCLKYVISFEPHCTLQGRHGRGEAAQLGGIQSAARGPDLEHAPAGL